MPYIGKSPSAGVRQRYQYTATAGQTTFSGTDLGNLTLTYTDNNFVDVFQNGVLLKGGGTDYTATSGTSVVLATGASVSDVIEIIVYDVFSVGNFFNRTDSDSRYYKHSLGEELILDADGDTSITADTDDQIDIKVGGTDVGKITGTNSELRIAGTVSDKDLTFQVNDGGSEITAGVFDAANAGAFQVRDGSASAPSLSFMDDPDTGFFRPNANTIDLSLEGTGRVRFQEDHGGETIFGVNVGTGGGGRVTVEQSTSGRSCINAKHDRTGADANGYPYGIISQFTNLGDSTNFHLYEGYGGGSIRFRVHSNGNVVNTNNSYGSLSDVKLKENISDASSQWDDIKAVRVRKFSWKTDERDEADMLGVIAQEIEAGGMGGLVSETIDTRETDDGGFEQTGTITKSVKYSVLYMKAIKALQEAMTRIETLEAKVTALESK